MNAVYLIPGGGASHLPGWLRSEVSGRVSGVGAARGEDITNGRGCAVGSRLRAGQPAAGDLPALPARGPPRLGWPGRGGPGGPAVWRGGPRAREPPRVSGRNPAAPRLAGSG